MKVMKVMKVLPITLAILTTVLSVPAVAKTVRISFAKGSYCGAYEGAIAPGDIFILNLNSEQRFVVKSETAVPHAVVNPDQKTGLSPVDTFENGNEVLYFTPTKGRLSSDCTAKTRNS
jgi:hypothetical protein